MPCASIALVALATAVDGLLAGASLDQSIKQLPERHRIGILSSSAYTELQIRPTESRGTRHSASGARL